MQPHKIRGDGLRSHDLIFDFRVCRFDIGDGSRGLVEIDQYRAVGYLLYELRQGRYGALARDLGRLCSRPVLRCPRACTDNGRASHEYCDESCAHDNPLQTPAIPSFWRLLRISVIV